MVLQSNFAKRFVSNAENTPPTFKYASPKAALARPRSSIHDAARRRRARTNGASKYTVEQAKRRSHTKPIVSLRFKFAPVPSVPDVEMKDAPAPSAAPTPNVALPKYLGRPQFSEVSKEALLAAVPDLGDVDPSFIRDALAPVGSELLRGLASVKASPIKDALPKELNIIMHDISAVLPTHMLAVYGPSSKSSSSAQRRKVTLYPAHSLVFAAHCAKLPAFAPSTAQPQQHDGHTAHTVPVRPLCLPSPTTYLRLASFLYTKRADVLLTSLMPAGSPPPASLAPAPAPSSPSQDDVLAYATSLAGTYTVQALLQHAMVVHGLWQNVCALGVFDDALWDTVDLAWRVLLTAIAVATGDVGVMLPEHESPSGSEEEES